MSIPCTRGAVDVVVAVADHHDVGPGLDAELTQGVGDDLVLGPPARLVRRPGEHGEAVGEAEVLEDAHGRLLRLGRCQREHHAGGGERVEHLGDAVVDRGVEQPAALVVHAVAVDDGPQPVAGHADQRQSELERRSDDRAQGVVRRHRQPEVASASLSDPVIAGNESVIVPSRSTSTWVAGSPSRFVRSLEDSLGHPGDGTGAGSSVSLAAWMACHTRSAVVGMSMWRTPRWRSGVDDGRLDGGRRADRAGLADALGAERVDERRRLHRHDSKLGSSAAEIIV